MVFSWGIHENFHGISPWKKHEKNITKAIKNPLIFQFSSAMKTLKFWANPWNTHENTMKILGCFSWPFDGVENAMNYKEGFSWCCSSWSFHEALNSWPMKNPWLFHQYWKINRSWKIFMAFWWLFEDPWKLIIEWPSTIFVA